MRRASLALVLVGSGCHIISGFDGLELRDGSDHVWSARFGDEGDQRIDSLAMTPNAIRVTGTYEGQLELGGQMLSATTPTRYLAELDGNGAPVWAMDIPPEVTLHGLVPNTRQVVVSYATAATFAGLELMPMGATGFSVLRITEMEATSVAEGTADLVTNLVAASGAADGDVLMGATYEGAIAILGTECMAEPGMQNIAIAKFENGTCQWMHTFGDAFPQSIDAIGGDSGSNTVITGTFQGVLDFGNGVSLAPTGGTDIFVAKFDPEGTAMWAKSYGESSQHQRPVQLDVRSAGNISLAGYFEGDLGFGSETISANNQGHDIYVARLDPTGATVWVNHYATINAPSEVDSDDVVTRLSLAVDASGDTLLAGHFRGTIDFGGPTRQAGDSLDVFVAKLNVDGDVRWSSNFGDGEDQCQYTDCAIAVTVDGDNDVVVGGGFEATMNLGGDDLESLGGSDVFLTKLGP